MGGGGGGEDDPNNDPNNDDYDEDEMDTMRYSLYCLPNPLPDNLFKSKSSFGTLSLNASKV